MRNVAEIKASTKIFHEVDEAGNYPIALVSSLNRTPFVEIHTISDAAMNVPTRMDAYFHRCSVYAQERSNDIVLELIHGLANLNEAKISPKFEGGISDPFPVGAFAKANAAPDFVRSWTTKNGIKRSG